MGHLSLVCGILLCTAGVALSSWSSAPGGSGQYHIQTDEGPERYFRYQTQSGQYRKEKRLQDGTVVGSYGWIDADGYLRLRDYIADNQGYRILKSKTVYVGQDRPIEEALKSAKKAPSQAGILTGSRRPVSAYPSRGTPAYPARGTPAYPSHHKGAPVTPAPTFSAYLPPVTQAPALSAYLPPVTQAPALSAYLPPSPPDTPLVLVSHNSIDSNTEKPEYDLRPTVAPVAAVSFTRAPPTYYTTTERPPAVEVSSSAYLPPTSPPAYSPPVSSSYRPPTEYSTPAPVVAITSNSLGDYRRKNQEAAVYQQQHSYESPSSFGDRNLYSTKTLNIDPFGLQSTPIDRSDQHHYQRQRPYNRYQSTNPGAYAGNQLGNGYDPQYPLYDGVSVTNNGFRYYLPKQYHEEENSGSDTRSGSFGYVDPFGIRRVIYYNTSPGSGFVHRKNNRYVGFDATPYDPRPL